jgi:hypothetical protein
MADDGSASATAASGPIVCQGFLVKHGGFFKKKVIKVRIRAHNYFRTCDHMMLSTLTHAVFDSLSFLQVQKRFFILRGNVLEWEKRKTSTDNHKKKGSFAIKGDTEIETIDAGSNLFEFQVSNFRRITCGHKPDKPYRLGTTSGEERDMWVSYLNLCHFLFLFLVLSSQFTHL